MCGEASKYMVELESYFNVHNIPIFIYRRFVHLVNEASMDNQDHIVYRVADVAINNEDQSYFHYVRSEPKKDKEIMEEIVDLLDGYIFYIDEVGERMWHFKRIEE